MLENKSDNISETRKDSGIVTMDGLTHQRSFERYHFDLLRPPLMWALGIARDRSNFLGYALLTQEQVKLWTSNLAGTFIGCFRTKAN